MDVPRTRNRTHRSIGPTARQTLFRADLGVARKASSDTGAFARTASIQRVRTVGGIAPTERCDATNAAKLVRVPYKATYFFYRVGP
ncbi:MULTISPECIES: DUF3455 domain-containing protein [unclassified Variovorax]|uniref:DUF3455 domain-containing protein n=1 Tax=Variovorax sp. dw_308 TaxID=2721546 RepID=UPI001BD6D600